MSKSRPPLPRAVSLRRRRLALAALAAAGLSASAPARADTKDVTIPKSVVFSAINAYAKGIEIRLDNWGSFSSAGGGTWHTNGSYVSFPSGQKVMLPVDRSPTVTGALRRYNAYVDDLATQSIDVKPDGDRIKVRLFFESAGDEIRIGCINRRKDEPCDAHVFKHTGDVNNAHVTAWLKPKIVGSKISIEPSDLTLDFDLSLDSWILEEVKNVASHFVDVKGKVRSAVKAAFMTELAKPAVRSKLSVDVNDAVLDKLADALKPKLGAAAGEFVKQEAEITNIKDDGQSYTVTVKYPDIVLPDAIKIVSFAPKSKSLTAGCPITFGFDATIKSDAKLSGQAWLEFEGGQPGEKLPWTMNKGGVATSTLVKKITGQPGQYMSGKARLAVSFKGTTGTHVVRSPMVSYQAACSKAQGGLALKK